MMRAFWRAADTPWAITEAALDQILEIAARENLDPEAVAAKLGRPLKNTQTTEERDGVAIIPMCGPIFPKANLLTEISGATSIQVLATDFTAAINNPAIRGIAIECDTPGGAVSGVNEFSQMIYDARGTKPIIAYVGNQCSSAGYWIACACDEVVIEDTAMIGSIGTVMGMKDTAERDAKSGVKHHEFISSQSPLKRAGPGTDAGRNHIQGMVDSLADVFISVVARNRGVSVDTVLADFGQGGELVGAAAVDAGMADRLGSFEGVIAELSQGGGSGWIPATTPKLGGSAASKQGQGVQRMTAKEAADLKIAEEKTAADLKAAADLKTAADLKAAADLKTAADAKAAAHADGVALSAAAVTSERARINAIIGCPEAKGRENLARTIALETETTPEAAKKLLAAAPIAGAPTTINPLLAAMAGVANPKVGTGAAETENDDAAEVAAIVAVMNRNKGAK